MGHSCGGGLAVQLAGGRLRENSAGDLVQRRRASWRARQRSRLPSRKSKARVLLITGDEELDIAFSSGKATFEAIHSIPIFYGWQNGLQHIGTFGAKNGGEIAVIARNWLEWTTRNDANRRPNVQGRQNCMFCKDPPGTS